MKWVDGRPMHRSDVQNYVRRNPIKPYHLPHVPIPGIDNSSCHVMIRSLTMDTEIVTLKLKIIKGLAEGRQPLGEPKLIKLQASSVPAAEPLIARKTKFQAIPCIRNSQLFQALHTSITGIQAYETIRTRH